LRLAGERPLLSGYALTLIAFAFSTYLTYREIFTIHAICSWCVSSAIVFTLLTIVGTLRILRNVPATTALASTHAGQLGPRRSIEPAAAPTD
jgi:hypothetical protein